MAARKTTSITSSKPALDVGANGLVVLRHRLALTSKEAAATCGVSSHQMSAWENGHLQVNGAAWSLLCLLAGEKPTWKPTAKDLKAALAWKEQAAVQQLADARTSAVKAKKAALKATKKQSKKV